MNTEPIGKKVRSQESGVRSQESGVRSQESGAGVRSQESGVRRQESGARSQEAGGRRQESGAQEAGVRSQEAGGRSQESGVRRQESGVRSQESGGRRQESGARSQESGVRRQEAGVRSQEQESGGRSPKARQVLVRFARRMTNDYVPTRNVYENKEQGVTCAVPGREIRLRSPKQGSRRRRVNRQKSTFQAGMCMKTKNTVRRPRCDIRRRRPQRRVRRF